ncbi:YfhL family 4Fe-4S dicluster ferredoxin [Acinetobacter sp. MD2]|uniref:YfhL family 4Fe-4S dicluster ferredoxin n=1 Tax=Acinetobacter sp. MD2 TaxID=2600066 RepID=UPI002D1EEEDF|nr:YfhL family 4Fe-4S dicluster ferredoxin [Acinetobacter sp. MD2]MEB3767703.1 YfhL family 4Fe-4S dicluster ferredoxin [Acinetobacter sp. MD2]
MALKITSECINCDMCLPECPNDAITEGIKVYEIEPERCTECVGFYASPTCIAVCPIHCIEIDPAHIEDQSQLCHKFTQLHLH